ncbi:hypothetical protein MTY_0626 [Moorella thermoacetica Y72]|uniref:Uncharacterized protein n=3 Tax=Neomoorella thermoacetica TaxID=1525 RepID=A0A1J5JZZ0_NEOTH|nr:hypothetical protein MOOR_11760 [Moorella thermoacetica]OIQ11135.1 hypothetical protein MOOTH_20070 [Moorella thermoacetica]GAF25294.1 hypothetical protein MTY_0626 [Moorella thermoacetica Y72]
MVSFRSKIWRSLCSCFYTIAIFILVSMVASIRRGIGPSRAILDLFNNQHYWVSQVLPLAVAMLSVNIFMLVRLREGEQKPFLRRPNFHRMRWRFTVISLGVLLAVGYQLAELWQKGFGPDDWDSYLLLLALAIPFIVSTPMAWLQKPDDEVIEALETGNFTRLADERDRLARMQAGNAALKFTIIFILVAGSLFDILVTHRWPARSLLEIELMAVAWHYFYSKFKSEI